VTDEPGLRARQRQRTREAIQDAATRLFLESGFQTVGVDEIAAAAEVSKRTLFKYFPSKEDLVVGSFADHVEEPARTVRRRPPGSGALEALHRHFLDGLARRDPITGLDDRPQTLAFVAMVLATPSLQARLLLYQAAAERALATALEQAGPAAAGAEAQTADAGRETARLAAAQIYAVHRTLAEDNRRHLADGATAQQRHPHAVAAADAAFALLRHGLADHYG
jgi:AcrR family transcriptional regulator